MTKEKITNANLEAARAERARKAKLQADAQEAKNQRDAELYAKKIAREKEEAAAQARIKEKRQEAIELHLLAAESAPEGSLERLKETVAICFIDPMKGANAAANEAVQYLLAYRIIHTIRNDVITSIYVYNPNNGEHEEDGKTRITELLDTIFEDHYSVKLAHLIVERVKNNTFISSEKFYEVRDPWKINCANGEIDLKHKRLNPFNPEGYHITSIPVKYDPSATCERIDQFIQTVLPDKKDQDGFYELAGYLLFRGMPLQHIFFFVNAGGGGKGQAIILLTALVGKRNTCAVTLKRQSTSNYASSAKKGKLLNAPGEIGAQTIVDSTEIKGNSGDDLVNIEAKYKPPETVKLYAKDVFAANDLPPFEDTSIGMMRRPILFNFTQRFVTQEEYNQLAAKGQTANVHVKILQYGESLAKDEAQMSGFLNKAIEGLHRIMSNNLFSNEKTPDEMKIEYLRRSNTIVSFFTEIVDACTDESGDYIPKSELYLYYEVYCADLGTASKTQDAFFKYASKVAGFEETKSTINGKRKRCFLGIYTNAVSKRMTECLGKPDTVRAVRAFSSLLDAQESKDAQKVLSEVQSSLTSQGTTKKKQQEGKKVGQVVQRDFVGERLKKKLASMSAKSPDKLVSYEALRAELGDVPQHIFDATLDNLNNKKDVYSPRSGFWSLL